MRTTIDARTEDLRGLRVPKHRTIGRSLDDAVLDDLERVDGRMADHCAIAIDIAFEHTDRMVDQFARNEWARAVVQHDVLEFIWARALNQQTPTPGA